MTTCYRLHMRQIALLLLVLGVGCGGAEPQSFGSSTASGHAPPLPPDVFRRWDPPQLPPGASVPKWDHYCTTRLSYEYSEANRLLDKASENGWELVTWSNGLACFKRPHVPAAPGGAPPTPTPPVAPAAR